MINFIKNKPFLLVGVAIFLMVVVFFIILSLFSNPTPKDIISPTITPFPESSNNHPDLQQYSDEYKKQFRKVAEEETKILQRDYLISQFIDTLPYDGSFITVSYVISTNKIILVLQKDKQSEGNQEFDALLIRNKIENRSWLKSLVIEIQ